MSEIRRLIFIAAAMVAPAMCAAGSKPDVENGKTRAGIVAYLATLKKK